MGKNDFDSMAIEPMAKPTRSLVDHTADVATAFTALFGTEEQPSEFAWQWLKFFRLPATMHRAFIRNGRLGCLVHDWGKANTGFAAMLARAGSQAVRHEVISALIMMQPRVWSWLESIRCVDLPLVLAAVAGHHLKAEEPKKWREAREFGAIQSGAFVSEFELTWDHAKIREQLATLATEFGIGKPLPEGITRVWSIEKPRPNAGHYPNTRKEVVDRIEDFFAEIEDDPSSDRSRMLRAVRSALIAADSAGSGLFRTHEESGVSGDPRDHIRLWIDKAFDPASNLDEAKIDAAVTSPAIEAKKSANALFAWNEFQDACANPERVPSRALLIAPCGSGKTLAAWRWIGAQCRDRPIGRAIFLYPTRGTATEGFRDYASHAGPELAALVHGTADLDLESLQPDRDLEDRIAEARLFSLRQWPKRVFSATVDQFLAFLQHDYGSTCLLPLLADSAVVLDEVHSYDRGMFTALTQFLEHFDVPVLAMTATMIDRRKAELAKHLKVIEGLGFSEDNSRLRRIADHKRYAVSTVAGIEEAKREAESALAKGLRVLWVVNTVDRAQQLARDFVADPRADQPRTQIGAPILGYHSRFKLRDRRDRHDEIVLAFKRSEARGAVLGITTQVCELSLDLDCDLLITEYAPISALIQRFGRCCRDQAAHESGRTGRVLLYEPESPLPYAKEEMAGVADFVSGLEGMVVSQSGLEERLASAGGSGFLRKDARFITDGPWACAGQDHFRDAEDLTRQALLPSDELEYQSLAKSKAKWRTQELIVPISKKDRDDTNRPPWMPSWLSFADVARHEYSKSLGYVAKSGGGFQIA